MHVHIPPTTHTHTVTKAVSNVPPGGTGARRQAVKKKYGGICKPVAMRCGSQRRVAAIERIRTEKKMAWEIGPQNMGDERLVKLSGCALVSPS